MLEPFGANKVILCSRNCQTVSCCPKSFSLKFFKPKNIAGYLESVWEAYEYLEKMSSSIQCDCLKQAESTDKESKTFRKTVVLYLITWQSHQGRF